MHADLVFLLFPSLGSCPNVASLSWKKELGLAPVQIPHSLSCFLHLVRALSEQHWPHSSLLGCNGSHCTGSLDPELCIKLQLADALILPAISTINL